MSEPAGQELNGKTAVVTGAAGPMGFAAARALAQAGCSVALVDLAGERLERAANGVAGSVAFAADLTSIGGIPALVERIESRFGSVAILVNNAGVLSNAKSQATDESEWRRVLAINLDAAFFLARAVVPGDEANALGSHHQHDFARGQNRRSDRRHRLRGIEGCAQRNDIFPGARARRRWRHRQRHRTRVRAHTDGHRAN